MNCILLNKYRTWRASRQQIDTSVAAALFIAIMSLAIAAGVMRWSWLILDEQVALRQDFNDLKTENEQLKTQFDFWLAQIQKERAVIQQP